MQHIRIHRITLLSIVTALAIGGCHKDQSATGDDARQAMGLYAKGFNIVLKEGRGLIEGYFQTFPKTGPSLDERPMPVLFGGQSLAASSIKEARASFDAAKSAAPTSLANLAPASDRLIAVTDKVVAIYTEAQKYYEAEGYKDDKLAKGKKLHGDMIAVNQELDVALGGLGDGMSSIEDAQAADEVKQREDAKDYGYWFRAFNLDAKRFLATVQHARTPEQAKQLGAAFKAIETSHAALAKFAADKGHDLASSFGGYVSGTDSFVAAGQKLLRAIGDSKATSAELDNAEQTLVSNYNSLVTTANSLYQVEAGGGLK